MTTGSTVAGRSHWFDFVAVDLRDFNEHVGVLTSRFEPPSDGLAARNGEEVGDPTKWSPGPTITESGVLAVSGLSSVPTNTGAQVTFTLSSAARVQVRVLNIAGRPVKALRSGRKCDAGANTLLWNAMSDSGARVPNGVYLVEVAAKAEDGSQTRALARVRVVR